MKVPGRKDWRKDSRQGEKIASVLRTATDTGKVVSNNQNQSNWNRRGHRRGGFL